MVPMDIFKQIEKCDWFLIDDNNGDDRAIMMKPQSSE